MLHYWIIYITFHYGVSTGHASFWAHSKSKKPDTKEHLLKLFEANLGGRLTEVKIDSIVHYPKYQFDSLMNNYKHDGKFGTVNWSDKSRSSN